MSAPWERAHLGRFSGGRDARTPKGGPIQLKTAVSGASVSEYSEYSEYSERVRAAGEKLWMILKLLPSFIFSFLSPIKTLDNTRYCVHHDDHHKIMRLRERPVRAAREVLDKEENARPKSSLFIGETCETDKEEDAVAERKRNGVVNSQLMEEELSAASVSERKRAMLAEGKQKLLEIQSKGLVIQRYPVTDVCP